MDICMCTRSGYALCGATTDRGQSDFQFVFQSKLHISLKRDAPRRLFNPKSYSNIDKLTDIRRILFAIFEFM